MPSGWKFWPEREPGPVDDAFIQTKWVRPYRPGPLRLAALVILWALAAYACFAGYLAITAEPTLAGRLIGLALTLVIAGSLALFGARVLSAGVWVNDFGVRTLGIGRSDTFDWDHVADVRRVRGEARVLGLPWRSTGETVWLVLKDGTDRETPLTNHSPDFLARGEAFDMAATAIERWFEETRPEQV